MVSDTIKLFVGTSPDGSDYEAEAVLEHSALKHSSLPIDITWMRQSKKGPYAGWNCASGRTPFSHFRWSIPAMCNFEGRGIYCDVDFVIMGDLADLWREEIPGILVTKPGAPDCILFDCAKSKKYIPTLDELKKLRDPHGTVSKSLPAHLVSAYTSGNWNYKTGKNTEPDAGIFSPQTKAVHYTRIENQVHLKHAVPRLKAQGREHWYTGKVFRHPTPDFQRLFDDLLVEAQAAGLTYESYGYGSDIKVARKDFKYSHHKGIGA